jgi:protein-S-isoprenylcysteine O-methyltransferase Ste14
MFHAPRAGGVISSRQVFMSDILPKIKRWRTLDKYDRVVKGVDMTALKSLLFLIVAPGMVAGYIPLMLLRRGPQIETGVFAYLAFPLWIVGGIILLWSFWNFLIEGRGTPVPIDPPKELVATGFYRYVRNPMYFGVLLILIGHFLWFGFWSLLVYTAFAFVATHLFVTFYEEPTLKRKFGTAYQEYLKRVPRWIPRFR